MSEGKDAVQDAMPCLSVRNPSLSTPLRFCQEICRSAMALTAFIYLFDLLLGIIHPVNSHTRSCFIVRRSLRKKWPQTMAQTQQLCSYEKLAKKYPMNYSTHWTIEMVLPSVTADVGCPLGLFPFYSAGV